MYTHRKPTKQVPLAKLDRIIASGEFDYVIIDHGKRISSHGTGSLHEPFPKEPISVRASCVVEYTKLELAVMHNGFLYFIRKDGDNSAENSAIYVDRESVAYYTEHDRLRLLGNMFFKGEDLNIIKFGGAK